MLVNWWAYTWGAYIRRGLYSEVYGSSKNEDPSLFASVQQALELCSNLMGPPNNLLHQRASV